MVCTPFITAVPPSRERRTSILVPCHPLCLFRFTAHATRHGLSPLPVKLMIYERHEVLLCRQVGDMGRAARNVVRVGASNNRDIGFAAPVRACGKLNDDINLSTSSLKCISNQGPELRRNWGEFFRAVAQSWGLGSRGSLGPMSTQPPK